MDKYINNGKTSIYVREELINNSDKAIFLVHGFSEHSGRYDDFINELKENKYSVFAMDLRGHGRTISKKGDMESMSKVIKDAQIVVDYIKNTYNFKKIGMFGHSTGGLVSCICASLNKEIIDFMVLSSPVVYCPKKFKILRFIPYKFIPFIKIKKKHSESKEMLEYCMNDKNSLHKFSVRSIGVIFNEGIKRLNKNLNIDCPILLVCGKQDTLLNETEEFSKFISKSKNPLSKIIIYNDAKHRIVHNTGSKERVIDIINWINETIVTIK